MNVLVVKYERRKYGTKMQENHDDAMDENQTQKTNQLHLFSWLLIIATCLLSFVMIADLLLKAWQRFG